MRTHKIVLTQENISKYIQSDVSNIVKFASKLINTQSDSSNFMMRRILIHCINPKLRRKYGDKVIRMREEKGEFATVIFLAESAPYAKNTHFTSQTGVRCSIEKIHTLNFKGTYGKEMRTVQREKRHTSFCKSSKAK
jgi:hypothetical protein